MAEGKIGEWVVNVNGKEIKIEYGIARELRFSFGQIVCGIQGWIEVSDGISKRSYSVLYSSDTFEIYDVDQIKEWYKETEDEVRQETIDKAVTLKVFLEVYGPEFTIRF